MTETHLARAEELAQACGSELLKSLVLALVGEVRRLRAGLRGGES